MRSVARVIFPILDPDLFQETIALAYESTKSYNYYFMSAKACIIGFSIFSRLVDFGGQACSLSNAKLYASVLQNILPTLAEVATVDGFQACLLLVRLLLEAREGSREPKLIYIYLDIVSFVHWQGEVCCNRKRTSSTVCV
jgi:hypothetical protein